MTITEKVVTTTTERTKNNLEWKTLENFGSCDAGTYMPYTKII
jgi:hypothetical protein